MKSLLFISLLILSGCNLNYLSSKPAFKVGDCMADADDVKRHNTPKENWETDYDLSIKIEKVLQVGKLKYRTVKDFYGRGRMELGSSDISWDNIMTKVPCTKRLEEYNETTSN